jgi:hypothetical protein
MEKYARQLVSEGVKIVEDIHINMESEIYRVLNLHYNRNNHIEVITSIFTPYDNNFHTIASIEGALKFPFRCGANVARIFPRNSEWKGSGAVVEEVNLQDYLATRRPRARVLQIAQLSGAIGIKSAKINHVIISHFCQLFLWWCL